MFKRNKKARRIGGFVRGDGFTLIELLTVIAIVGLLSTLVIISTDRAREKARDAARVADLNSFDAAIELYFEYNGLPPKVDVGETVGDGDDLYANWSELSAALAGYIKGEPPNDPFAVRGPEYGYAYCADASNYILAAVLEVATDVRNDVDAAVAVGGGVGQYAAANCVYSGKEIGGSYLVNGGVAAIDCGDGAAAGIDAAGVGSDRTGSTFCLGYTNTQ